MLRRQSSEDKLSQHLIAKVTIAYNFFPIFSHMDWIMKICINSFKLQCANAMVLIPYIVLSHLSSHLISHFGELWHFENCLGFPLILPLVFLTHHTSFHTWITYHTYCFEHWQDMHKAQNRFPHQVIGATLDTQCVEYFWADMWRAGTCIHIHV